MEHHKPDHLKGEMKISTTSLMGEKFHSDYSQRATLIRQRHTPVSRQDPDAALTLTAPDGRSGRLRDKHT